MKVVDLDRTKDITPEQRLVRMEERIQEMIELTNQLAEHNKKTGNVYNPLVD